MGCKVAATERSRTLGVALLPALFVLISLLPTGRQSSFAQPTNVEVFGTLAIDCLGAVPDTLQAFVLSPPDTMHYVRAALNVHWLKAGKKVWLASAEPGVARPVDLSVLRYVVDEATIVYETLSRSSFERFVWLGVHYDLVSAGGRVLADNRCRRSFSDEIQTSNLLKVQPDPYPEARAALVRKPGFGRIVEPVVLGTAMATIVYLFFTVRS
jgi:hypothetical protein